MFTAVVAAINSEWTDSGVPGPTVNGESTILQVLLGPEYIAQEDAVPRVVFDPSDDVYTDPREIGANPRPLLDVWAGCDVHVWAADFDQAHAYAQLLVRSMQRMFSGAQFRVLGGRWTKTTIDVQHGREYVVRVAIRTPVTDSPWQTIAGGTLHEAHVGRMIFPKGEGGGPDGDVEAC